MVPDEGPKHFPQAAGRRGPTCLYFKATFGCFFFGSMQDLISIVAHKNDHVGAAEKGVSGSLIMYPIPGATTMH